MTLRLNGSTSGYVEIDAPAVAGDNTLALPSTPNGSLVALDSSGRLGIGTSSVTNAANLDIQLNTVPATDTYAKLQLRSGNYGYIIKGGLKQGAGGQLHFDLNNNGSVSTQMVLDTGGRLGIGTTSPNSQLQVVKTGASDEPTLRIQSENSSIYLRTAGSSGSFPTGGGGNDGELLYIGGNFRVGIGTSSGKNLIFLNGNAYQERARIDTSGRFLVGTSASAGTGALLQTRSDSFAAINQENFYSAGNASGPNIIFAKSRGSVASPSVVSANDYLGIIRFRGYDGTDYETSGAQIAAQVDGTPGANDMPGRLVFFTTADGTNSLTERMRISSNGTVWIGKTGIDNPGLFDTSANLKLYSNSSTTSGAVALESQNNSTALRYHFVFSNTNGIVGSISTNASATAYTTSSDYRLKENVTAVIDGITRLQQLKPSRFNFIADPDTVVDGFLAHEAQEVVPECVTGTKDEVDEDGNPVYQGIDQSKLVPLLTAALQEAVAKIEALEARITTLEVTP